VKKMSTWEELDLGSYNSIIISGSLDRGFPLRLSTCPIHRTSLMKRNMKTLRKRRKVRKRSYKTRFINLATLKVGSLIRLLLMTF
jgi:hypothetical protein